MILAIYDWKFAEDRTHPVYYRAMRVTVKVMDLEKMEKIPAYFTFTIRNKEDFEMDLCEVVADSDFQIANRAMVSGDILRATKQSVLTIAEDDSEQIVVEYFIPILDYIDKNFIQHFGRSDYFLPPNDRLNDRTAWGIYGDFLMDSSDTYHIGETIIKIVNHPIYDCTIEQLVNKEGIFKSKTVSTKRFDEESYTPEALKPYGGELIGYEQMGNRRGQLITIPQIRFPNILQYEEWLKTKVLKSTELPKMEPADRLRRKEQLWRNAQRRKEVGW